MKKLIFSGSVNEKPLFRKSGIVKRLSETLSGSVELVYDEGNDYFHFSNEEDRSCHLVMLYLERGTAIDYSYEGAGAFAQTARVTLSGLDEKVLDLVGKILLKI